MSTASTDSVSPTVEPPRPIHAGLEIGTSKICVAVAEARDDGSLHLLAIGESASRGVRKGEIVDPHEAAQCIRQALNEAEAQLGFSIDRVSVSFSGDLRRLHRTLDCLGSLQILVDSVIPGAVASAHGILRSDIDRPTLLIDLGGGTAEYCIIDRRGIWAEGVLPLGGDHLTCDLSIGLKIPMADAEGLKISKGTALLGGEDSGLLITYESEHSSYRINRNLMRGIIHLRVREIFEEIRSRIVDQCSEEQGYTQVILTGGTSLLPGIGTVAEEVFGAPEIHLENAKIAGNPQILADQTYTTAIGLTIIDRKRSQKLDRSEEDLDIPTFMRNSGESHQQQTISQNN